GGIRRGTTDSSAVGHRTGSHRSRSLSGSTFQGTARDGPDGAAGRPDCRPGYGPGIREEPTLTRSAGFPANSAWPRRASASTFRPMPTVPVEHNDPINAKILAVSEDLVSGFHSEPFHVIAEQSGVELPVVLERIRAMLEAGIIRRVRQTLLSTK